VEEEPVTDDREPGSGDDDRVAPLRGAGVPEIEVRQLGRVLIALCLVALVVTSTVLFVAGARKNHQVDELRHHGVPVTVTISGCIGLLGGSGSNGAGFSCTGSYRVAGRRYVASFSAEVTEPPGSHLRAVTAAGDPSLVATVATVAGEHPSGGVYVLPGVLLAAAVAFGLGLVLTDRRRRRTAAHPRAG
jgi:hypothetical protein